MNRLNIRRSFSAKLSLWVLLLTVPVFFASVGMLFRQSRRMILGESIERANGVLDASLQRINRYLITTETATNAYGWIIEKSMKPDSLVTLANRIVRFNPYTDGCAISTEPGVLPQYPKGFMAYSIREEGDSITTAMQTDYNYFKKKWYREARDELKSGWVIYYDESNPLGLDMDGMIATYSKPLFSADSTLLGVVSTELSLLHLSKILSEEKPYPHSYYILIDEQGRYVGHPDSTRLFNKTIFSIADPQKQIDLIALGHQMTMGAQGSLSVVINDAPSMVCYKPVPNTTWSLAIVCPNSDIFAGYNRFVYLVVSLLVVGLILIVIYCHQMVTRSLRPLCDLLDKTQEITKGNMDVVIERSTRIDEMGCLQNSYVTMLESLKRYTDNVRAASDKAQNYNEELEQATKLVVEADNQKTAFIQNMTHQLRTPLNIIMGYAQILSMSSTDGMSEEEIKTLAGTMDHNSKLLTRLVLMLFDSSDIGVSESVVCQEHEPVLANETLREMVDYVMGLCPGIHIGFETEVSDDFVISTNRKYLQYSMAEVLLNAVKYSDCEHIMARIERTETTASSLRILARALLRPTVRRSLSSSPRSMTSARDWGWDSRSPCVMHAIWAATSRSILTITMVVASSSSCLSVDKKFNTFWLVFIKKSYLCRQD